MTDQHFVEPQDPRFTPTLQEVYISRLIPRIPYITSSLSRTNTIFFYDTIGLLIGAEASQQVQIDCIQRALEGPFESWNIILENFRKNQSLLLAESLQQDLAFFVAICNRVMVHTGQSFYKIFDMIHNDLIQIYTFLSQSMRQDSNLQGEEKVGSFRKVKTEILL